MNPAASVEAIPPPPVRAWRDRALDLFIWGGLALLLIVGARSVEIGKLADLASGRLATDRAEALVAAYSAVRPLTSAERRLMPALLRAAALRFWISRLWDAHLPRDAKLLTAHDPDHFERVLRARVATPWHPLPGSDAPDPLTDDPTAPE